MFEISDISFFNTAIMYSARVFGSASHLTEMALRSERRCVTRCCGEAHIGSSVVTSHD